MHFIVLRTMGGDRFGDVTRAASLIDLAPWGMGPLPHGDCLARPRSVEAVSGGREAAPPSALIYLKNTTRQQHG